jgi:hypothetical protein
MRAELNFLSGIKAIVPVQSSPKKYSASCLTQISSSSAAIPARLEGRFANVTDVGRGCGGREVSLDERHLRGRPSRVVLTPRRWRQVAEQSADDGGKKARSPGRARNRPLKPSRGECRAFSGVTVVTNTRANYHYARGCGRIGRPAFPAPSDFRRRDVKNKTRADHAAGSRSYVCSHVAI